MTAIAGVAGASKSRLEGTCKAILRPLGPYSASPPRFESLSGAVFGAAPYPQLPEDDYDRQPLTAAGRFMLVADIRLDNREELIRDLRPQLPEPARCSDADVLLAAWMRRGEACLADLVGDFAFAIWDSSKQRLTLARDPVGQRPLFFASDSGTLAFASMPIGLLNWRSLRTEFHLERLATMLLGYTHLSEATYFEGISRVLPGHLAVFEAGRVTQSAYWAPSMEPLVMSDGAFVEAYHEHFEQAVRARVRRRSGPIGVHLSSGYDSSAVAETAARVAGDPRPIAFTSAPRIGFDGPVPPSRIADESCLAAETAEMLQLRHIVVRPAGGVLELLRSQARLYQEPDRNIVNMEWWTAIHRAARELGISTLLVGQLGNLTIHAGGLPLLAEYVRRGAWLEWWREASAAARSGRARWRGILINSFEGRMGARLVRGLHQHLLGLPSDAQSYVRREWVGKSHDEGILSATQLLEGTSYERRLTLIRTQDIGVYRKGALGESGIDERDPTADRRMIEFSLRLPPRQLMYRGEWRPLARRSLRGHLPDRIVDLQARGYQGADWFERLPKSGAEAIVEEVSTSRAVNELLDLGKIRRGIAQWPSTGAADLNSQIVYRTRLLTALSTAVFLQELEPLISSGGSA